MPVEPHADDVWRSTCPSPQVFEQLFQAYEQKMPVPGMKEFDQLVNNARLHSLILFGT